MPGRKAPISEIVLSGEVEQSKSIDLKGDVSCLWLLFAMHCVIGTLFRSRNNCFAPVFRRVNVIRCNVETG